MFSRVLIPISDSVVGHHAAQVGLMLAHQLNSSVVFLHVLNDHFAPSIDLKSDSRTRDSQGEALLEPWMLVEVETPDEFTGPIMGSLNSKRAMITETAKRGPSNIIRCEVPLGEMFGYTTDLRSMSQGRAGYSMEPSEYKPVPNSMVEKLAKKA